MLQPELLKKMAVDSVQSQLIQSLDRDCRSYRAKIKELTAQLEDQALSPPPPPIDALKALQAQVDGLQAELDASKREREQLMQTVGRLSREKSSPAQQLLQAEEDLAKARAEREGLRMQLKHSEEQLAAAWREAKDAQSGREADAAARASSALSVEAKLAEAEKQKGRAQQAEAAVRAELAEAKAAHEEVRQKLQQTADELALAQASAAQANLECYEAKGESTNLARRLAGMAERKEEQHKKAALEEGAKLKRVAEQAQGALRGEVSGLKSEVSGLRSENSRANDMIKTLRAKLVEAANAPHAELASVEKDAAKMKKLAEKHERQSMQLEIQNNQLTAENLKLRTAADEARAEAEAAKAKASLFTSATTPAVRDTPKETLAPMAAPEKDKSSQFTKYQARVKALEAEKEELQLQLEAALQQQRTPKKKRAGA